ncbi:TolB domain-containing protein [Alkalihalobacterium alkalinitrilicum]|uniref:TolB domain-containing protein n=1 Tax=Alkalihalobacterium alkalinitrilicum TaxID=427920 RepID=UPI001EE4721F|nr:TolB domain-containing protein [Alkalihalobacterium alkalinitrilicum]
MKVLQVLIVLFLLLPINIHAEAAPSNVKVAFIRDEHLWTKINNKEERISDKIAEYTSSLMWSYDGSMLLYQKKGQSDTQNEIWVYNIQTRQHQLIFSNGYRPKWSPTENIVAFKSDGVLNISDLKSFYNFALGVDDYEWRLDGKGFIVSSSADLRPKGWTNPILYTISITDGYKNLKSLTEHVKELFVIPNQVQKGELTVMAINATSLTYSPNQKWISFIVSPTASLAMDSNMLCVISFDGQNFEAIDEVIQYLDEPKWAYKKNILGYIAGGGRIVFGFKNKDLKVKELPSSTTFNLTPPNYAELGFTWVNNHSLIVSRVQEREWSNDPSERPKPSLYHLNLNGKNQTKITTPPKNYGDYQPKFLTPIQKVTWIRKKETDFIGDLWMADSNGENAEPWIRNVANYSLFPCH